MCQSPKLTFNFNPLQQSSKSTFKFNPVRKGPKLHVPLRDAIVLQIKLRSLILDLVHMLDVVKMLVSNNVSSSGDWLWQKQLRFYLSNKVQSGPDLVTR